jgi:hypothetical protein
MATTNPTTEPRLTQHPISAAFPAMLEDDFITLMNDIKIHGQRLPILVYDDQVLDGWHRYRACQLAAYGPGRPSKNTPHKCGVSTKQAAATLHVGTRTVEGAKAVLKHGVPEIIHAVETGATPVGPALALVRSGVTKSVAEKGAPASTDTKKRAVGTKKPELLAIDATKKLPAPGKASRRHRLQVVYSLHDDLFAALERLRSEVRWSDRHDFDQELYTYRNAARALTKAAWERPLDPDDIDI